jgi:Ca-activated chloride channel family protein
MNDFHFIRPLWLIATFVVFIALYLLKKYRCSQSGWQQFLPRHLTAALLEGNSENNQQKTNTIHYLMIPLLIGLLAIIALAGPTWQKLPQPVYQIDRGSVLIMDMSYSMYATDLMPNRLTRARYKANDLLEQLNDGDVGLIAYAGDAFVISPITEDVNNITLLLPALSPDIMPELGSNPLSALMLADELLKNAGHVEGDIYWLTDGIDSEDIQDITKWSREVPHRLNILGIGTKNGAPIKLTNGELLKDGSGAIVIPKLSKSYLDGVASRGHGSYRTITNDFSDITALVNNSPEDHDIDNKKTNSLEQGDQWQEMGPYLVLLILPLVLTYFRRGISLAILPICFLLTPIDSVYASVWSNLWQTKDQQAKEKFNNKEYLSAAEKFENSNWQASAFYKAKAFDKALTAFEKDKSANGLYNQGNTLAQLNKVDEAIEAYKKALKIDPNLSDAKDNKEKLEALKKQQEQQQQDGDNQQEKTQDEKGEQQEGDAQNDKKQSQDTKNNEQKNQDQQSDSQQQDSDQQKKELSEQNKGKEEDKDQDLNEQKQDQQAQDDQKKPSEQQGQAQQLTPEEQQKLDQELQEKHLQLLNKVTDDPYLLLRNKMQLEYKKRRQQGYRSGVNKQW